MIVEAGSRLQGAEVRHGPQIMTKGLALASMEAEFRKLHASHNTGWRGAAIYLLLYQSATCARQMSAQPPTGK